MRILPNSTHFLAVAPFLLLLRHFGGGSDVRRHGIDTLPIRAQNNAGQPLMSRPAP